MEKIEPLSNIPFVFSYLAIQNGNHSNPLHLYNFSYTVLITYIVLQQNRKKLIITSLKWNFKDDNRGNVIEFVCFEMLIAKVVGHFMLEKYVQFLRRFYREEVNIIDHFFSPNGNLSLFKMNKYTNICDEK